MEVVLPGILNIQPHKHMFSRQNAAIFCQHAQMPQLLAIMGAKSINKHANQTYIKI